MKHKYLPVKGAEGDGRRAPPVGSAALELKITLLLDEGPVQVWWPRKVQELHLAGDHNIKILVMNSRRGVWGRGLTVDG